MVNFYTAGNTNELFGPSNEASSVFLSVTPSDEANTLSWEYNVPWDNTEFVIYKENLLGEFDSLDITTDNSYLDPNLVNGRTYCYYIEARGDYGIANIDDILINKSQEVCGTPIDLIPPCPPILNVANVCDEAINCADIDLFNSLDWRNPNTLCENTDDVVAYNIYYKPTLDSEFSLIEVIGNATDTFYLHTPDFGLAGCYAVTAVDSFANESNYSNEICVDNCPRYMLPNTFTPNDDGQNDVFIPYPYCFIDRIELIIFNRWGEQVFSTSDPNINWTGRNNGGQTLPVGTYYYQCRVFEDRVNGIVEREELLSGYIELFR